MPKIDLNTSDDNSSVVVSGDFGVLFANRRSLRLLRDTCDFKNENNVVIFKITDDLSNTINRIKKAAGYVGIDISFGANASKELAAYEQDEEDFALFSEKAKKIRNNDCDLKDFRAFEESLLSNLPGRRLYDLQLLSAYHMAFTQNECNFSVPGAGKTSVVYGAYSYLHHLEKDDSKKVDAMVVICPLNAFGPWEDEFESCFLRKPISWRLAGGLSLEEKTLKLHTTTAPDLILLSYASAPRLKDDLAWFLSRFKTMLVLDEAHKIKNTSGGIIAESIVPLGKIARSRIVLTGTPAPNGYEDLLNLYKFIWPNKKIIKFNSGQLQDMSRNSNDCRVSKLISDISPFFIRVRKSDLHLPPCESETIAVRMKPAQEKVYRFIESKFVSGITGGSSSAVHAVLTRARLIRLMQAATNPVLLAAPIQDSIFEFGEIGEASCDREILNECLKYFHDEIPAKYEKALELVRNILGKGGKVVIWATFVSNIERLALYLANNGILVECLYGATPVENETKRDYDAELTREKIVKKFNDPKSGLDVIIANPSAVSESISLHKCCHNAIYLERSFNCAHFLQSKDRIHRYGLPSGIITRYYYLSSIDTVDETVSERLNLKEERLNQIVESMPIPLFNNIDQVLGQEDIISVMRDYAKRAAKY